MHKFDTDTLDQLKALNPRLVEQLFEAHLVELERSVLQSNIRTESDFAPLAIRRAELEGARKLVTGVTGYLNSLRKRHPPG